MIDYQYGKGYSFSQRSNIFDLNNICFYNNSLSIGEGYSGPDPTQLLNLDLSLSSIIFDGTPAGATLVKQNALSPKCVSSTGEVCTLNEFSGSTKVIRSLPLRATPSELSVNAGLVSKFASKANIGLIELTAGLNTYNAYQSSHGDAGVTFRAGLMYGTSAVIAYGAGYVTFQGCVAVGSAGTLGTAAPGAVAAGFIAGTTVSMTTQYYVENGFKDLYDKMGYRYE